MITVAKHLKRSLFWILNEVTLMTVAKCIRVTSTIPADMPRATPLMPRLGFDANAKIAAVLTIAPTKLFIIAAFANPKACNAAASGP